MEETYVPIPITMRDTFRVRKQIMKVGCVTSVLKYKVLTKYFSKSIACPNLYIFSWILGKGITNCTMVAGELRSESEQYLEITSTAHECQRRAKIREPEANGITWTHNDHQCWAKFDSSDSIMDTKGCSFCSSCFFSMLFYD